MIQAGGKLVRELPLLNSNISIILRVIHSFNLIHLGR